jgi:hypothetical protein
MLRVALEMSGTQESVEWAKAQSAVPTVAPRVSTKWWARCRFAHPTLQRMASTGRRAHSNFAFEATTSIAPPGEKRAERSGLVVLTPLAS